MTVHILRGGVAICGTMNYPPSTWPEDHKWVGYEEVEHATCKGCLSNFKKLIEAIDAGIVAPSCGDQSQ